MKKHNETSLFNLIEKLFEAPIKISEVKTLFAVFLMQQKRTVWDEDLENKSDVEARILKGIQQKLQIKPSNIPVIPFYKRQAFKYAVAAMLVVLLGVTYFIKAIQESNQITTTSVTQTIPVGGSKAVLTSADGTVTTLEKGAEIKLKNATSNGEELIYNTNEEVSSVEYNSIKVPRGGQFVVQLADGSKVWLNSESELKFPTSFKSLKERHVQLISGEAYFEVYHNKNQPFKVETSLGKITVLGTEFNISNYDQDFAVTLVNGKVELSNSDLNITPVQLTPNQQAVLSANKQDYAVRSVDAELYSSWKDGKFYFNNESLEVILTKVSRWFDVTVHFENQDLKNITFTGAVLKDEPLNIFMDLISESSDINYSVNKNQNHYEVTILKK